MPLLELKRTFFSRNFLRLSYGNTANNNKGRRYDADWQNTSAYNQITDFGTMNSYGKQEIINLDYGVKMQESVKTQTGIFLGWNRHKSTNELKMVLRIQINWQI